MSLRNKLNGTELPDINPVTSTSTSVYTTTRSRQQLPDGNKYVILTFDDGWASQYQAFKKMYPWKGTLYISSALIGQQDRLTNNNLKEMYSNGWDISNHTANHQNLTKLSLKQATAEVEKCSAWIVKQGFRRNMAYKHFAYPEGGYNAQIIELLAQRGILTARTTNPGNDTSDYLQLGRTSLSGMTPRRIRDNIMSDQKLLILNFHRLVKDSSSDIKQIDLKESNFQEVLKAIRDSKRKVITITEWFELTE